MTGAQVGTFPMSFALVEEVAWLADPPIEEALAEGDITLTACAEPRG